jgi:hypothetical protein
MMHEFLVSDNDVVELSNLNDFKTSFFAQSAYNNSIIISGGGKANNSSTNVT